MSKLKLKKEIKEKYRDFDTICKETAKIINGMAKELSTRMWQIGRILVESREKVNPKFKGAFYQGVANHMEEDLSLNTLYQCAKFFERFPDFLIRIKKSELSTYHYWELSHIADEDKREELEEKAVERDWSISDLKQAIRMERPEIALAEAVEAYQNFVSALTNLRENFVRMQKAKVKGVLSRNQLDGLARTLWYFVKVELPEMVRFLEENDAVLEPMFKQYVKKFEGV